jgi:hypothetical protein
MCPWYEPGINNIRRWVGPRAVADAELKKIPSLPLKNIKNKKSQAEDRVGASGMMCECAVSFGATDTNSIMQDLHESN